MDIRQLRLEPIISVINNPHDFSKLKEFPWRPFYEKLLREYSREMLAIYYGNEFIGAMALDYSERIPELIFFEIKNTYRGRGFGRLSLFLLFNHLKKKGFDKIFIQTGRPEIYARMGFKFKKVEKRGIIINLDDYEGGRIPGTVHAPVTLIYTDEYLFHNYPKHPDTTQRVSQTIQLLREANILQFLNIIPPRPATEEELLMVHTKEHIHRVREASERGEFAGPNAPTIKETYRCALLSFGGALTAGELVNKYKRIFVLSRPPGHHAGRNMAKGFCFFNNMAGLALKLFKEGMRPMVIDWDIHHGDGTQEILYDKPIMFVSIHQKFLYPYTGFPEEKGEGPGYGYTQNIQVPPLITDEEYFEYFKTVTVIADEYKPDIILVSAGQDGLKEDKLSGTLLTPAVYYEMTKLVREIAENYAEGRIIILLEGGYALEKLAEANFEIIRALGGEELERLLHQQSRKHLQTPSYYNTPASIR